MKHKAQESLDTLWCKATSDSNYCEANLYRGVCNCNFEKSNETLQDLINCQLTKREIEIAICDLEVVEMEFKHSYMKDTLKRIIEKLKKQKEMWVSDDETN